MMGWLPGRPGDGDEDIVKAGDQLGFPSNFLPPLKIGKLISLGEWIESPREELHRGAQEGFHRPKIQMCKGPTCCRVLGTEI